MNKTTSQKRVLTTKPLFRQTTSATSFFFCQEKIWRRGCTPADELDIQYRKNSEGESTTRIDSDDSENVPLLPKSLIKGERSEHHFSIRDCIENNLL